MSYRFSLSKQGRPLRKMLHPAILLLTIFLITAALPGCTLVRQAFAPEPLPVLDVRTFDRNVSLRHRVSITYGERNFTLQTITERNDDRMVIVGLSSYSTTLFTIRIHRTSLDVESNGDLPLDLRRFATDLQWALWPSISERDGITVQTDEVDGGIKRTLFRDGGRIGTITASKQPPWTGDITFTRAAGYSMNLSLLTEEPISSTP